MQSTISKSQTLKRILAYDVDYFIGDISHMHDCNLWWLGLQTSMARLNSVNLKEFPKTSVLNDFYRRVRIERLQLEISSRSILGIQPLLSSINILHTKYHQRKPR